MPINSYLRRHQLFPARVLPTPRADLGMLVVIPCYWEPDILTTLQSLQHCVRPSVSVEVLVLFNHSETASLAVKHHNRRMYAVVRAWARRQTQAWLTFHALYYPDLIDKHAGVGLARKIGLDEGVRRLHAVQTDGLLINLDADCTVDPQYFCAIEAFFQQQPQQMAAHLNFQHPLTGPLSAQTYQGMLRYELYLRYYRYGLAYAGSPHAVYAIGSCIVVRASAYQKIGGMNRRKAGEDFYFLQKLNALGVPGWINSSIVTPCARLSQRTPFGTGQAVAQWLQQGASGYATHPPQVFQELRALFAQVRTCYARPGYLPAPSPLMQAFLAQQRGAAKLVEIHANAARWETFEKRFHQWFNGLMCLKFIHFAQVECYPQVELREAAAKLLHWLGCVTLDAPYTQLLATYRDMDQKRND